MVLMWWSEDKLQELVLSFSLVGPRDHVEHIRLGGEFLYLLIHLSGPLGELLKISIFFLSSCLLINSLI